MRPFFWSAHTAALHEAGSSAAERTRPFFWSANTAALHEARSSPAERTWRSTRRASTSTPGKLPLVRSTFSGRRLNSGRNLHPYPLQQNKNIRPFRPNTQRHRLKRDLPQSGCIPTDSTHFTGASHVRLKIRKVAKCSESCAPRSATRPRLEEATVHVAKICVT